MGRRAKRSGPQALPPALREALTVSNSRWGRHIKEKMTARAFDMNDVIRVARNGAIKRPPELDIKHGTYEYVLEGTDGDGRPLEIVFAIGHRHVFLITGRRP